LKTAFILAFLLANAGVSVAQDRKPEISKEEITQHIAKDSGCEPGDITINSFEKFDFIGDGIGQAVVVASTCNTGTAGPDIHAVFARQPDQSLAELKIEDTSHKPAAEIGVLLGRVFYDLNAANGLLVETFHDTSGRTDPLVIKFRWNDRQKEFQAVSIKAGKPYRASFDCAKAKTYIENAVCYIQTLAFLDVRVADTYAQLQDQLEGADADQLIHEQKEWLEKGDVICAPDWDISGCLGVLYQARLLELQHYRPLHHLKPLTP
jgi:uncharacterized protein YecT (DUF1311 family)